MSIFEILFFSPDKQRFFVNFEYFANICVLFWLVIVFLFVFALFFKKMNWKTLRCILDFILMCGIGLLVVYFTKAYINFNFIIITGLGGISEKELAVIYNKLEILFICRTTQISLLLLFALFTRFSLFPYIAKQRKKKDASPANRLISN